MSAFGGGLKGSFAYFFEFELDWLRIQSRDRLCDVIADFECFVFGFTGQVYE